jgi:tetratricopeptide (TPR) repeat protein
MFKKKSSNKMKLLIKNRIVSGMVIFLVFCSFLLSAQDFKKAIQLFQDEQINTAKKYMVDLSKQYPKDAKVYYYLGKAYIKTNNSDSAELSFRKGLEVNPYELLNYAGMGGIELNKGNQEGAIANFEKVKKVKSSLTLLEVVYACMSGKVQDRFNAEKFLDLANDVNSKDPYLHLTTGDYYLQLKNPGNAANAYERTLYFDPKSYIAYVKLGKIYADAKNYPEALKAYSNALKIDSTGLLVYRYLGDLYYTHGQYPEAKLCYQKYLAHGEVTPAIEERYAYILFFNKNYEECEKSLDKLILMYPIDPVLFRLKAYINYETEKYPEGLQYIEKFLSIQDTGKILVTDHLYYGRLLIKNQQDSLGLIQLIKATELDSTKTETFEEIAKQYSKMKKHKPAIYWYKKLMNSKAGNNVDNIYYQIGREYYMWAGDTASLAITPSLVDSLLHTDSTAIAIPSAIADSLARLELYKVADSSFSKLIALKPDSYLGYLFRARTRARLDPETSTGLARTDYEKTLSILEPGDKEKSKKYLIECYRYLAFYFYMMNENGIKQSDPNAPSNIESSLFYWKKILELEPQDAQALTAIDNINKLK